MQHFKLIFYNLILIMATNSIQAQTAGKYADVNGIKMYYEIHGSGRPLVLIHGGGSTIKTNFSRILPLLAQTHQVIAVELQAHGQTCFELGMRHADKVRKLIIASAFYKRDGAFAGFWKGFDNPKFSDMPQVYKDEFLKIKDQAALMNMFNKDVQRMREFKDWKDEDLRSIQAPALIVSGDSDVATLEHTVAMFRLFTHGRLAILPGTHGSYMGEAFTPNPESKVPDLFVAMVNEFLAE
jgi:pimeloyl-ACP methyl ester carboxylesterase